MENLVIPCPECGNELHLPDRSLLGRAARCPQCDHKFLLEEPGAEQGGDTALNDQQTIAPSALAGSATSSSSAPKSIPKNFGRYRILRQLGQGAMGAVYLAHDTQLDRQVALKIPKFGDKDDPELLARFLREARSAATLQHANICPVFDVGEIDGAHYFTMAYIEGHTLSNYINRDEPPPERKVALLIRKLAQALDHAHELGVVHRDLKPSNIMIDRRNDPVVMDFGLARQIETETDRLTQTGTILGTPAYMSPEQVRAEWDKVGPRSDIYSLGVILYELLTGDLPFSGAIGTVIGQILTKSPVQPRKLRPNLDPGLEAICLTMMAKDADDRYQTMADVSQAIQAYLQGERPQALETVAEAQSTEKSTMVETRATADQRQTESNKNENQQPVRRKQSKQPASATSQADEDATTPAWYLQRSIQIAAAVLATGLLAIVIGVGLNRGSDPADSSPERPQLSFAQLPRQSAKAGQELSFGVKLIAPPVGIPANELEYRLGPQAPAGSTIDRNSGLIRWTPPADQPAGDYQFAVRVNRAGETEPLGEKQVVVTLVAANQPPVIDSIKSRIVDEETELAFHITATDADSPQNQLVYRLGPEAPQGAVLDPKSGLFRWQPREVDGPGQYLFSVTVADNGNPPAENTRQFTVNVNEVNQPPRFLPVENVAAEEDATTIVDMKAVDPDLPAGHLTYRLGTDAPPGCKIDADTGRLTWTPPPGAGGKSYRIVVNTSDDATTAMTAETSFIVTVAAAERVAQFSCFESATDEKEYLQLVRQLIDEGWKRKRSESPPTSALLEAEKLCSRDPRLYHAAGLLALKRLQYSDAGKQFVRAAKQCEYPYLPAWKTLIRRQLVKKQYSAALLELVELSKAIEGDSPYLSDSVRSDCAKWMGQIVGFLEGPSGLRRVESIVRTNDAQIAAILKENRQKSYQDGKTSSADLFASLSGVRQQQQEDAAADRKKQQQEIESKERQVRGEQEKIRAAAVKTKEDAEKLIKGYDGQLAGLEREFNRLTAVLQTLAAAISTLQDQQASYNSQYQTALQNKDNNAALRYKNLANQAGRQASVAQQQYVGVSSQIAVVNQQAGVVIRNRQAVIAAYQKETGKLLQQDKSLDKWAKRLDSQEKALDRPRRTRTGRAAATDRKLRSLDTYVTFDLEAEKYKLLSSLQVVPEKQ